MTLTVGIQMAAEPRATHRFDLSAGTLALNFVNTLEGRYDDQPGEMLPAYGEIIAFMEASGVIDERHASRLRKASRAHPKAATASHADAVRLREALFGVFHAIAEERDAPADDLAALNVFLSRTLPHGRVVAGNARDFVWQWESDETDLTGPLWPIAYDALELLLHGPLDRVRECAADDCGWLFIDTTRNRARRWCSMQSCGNRAKVQHFRERARAAEEPGNRE